MESEGGRVGEGEAGQGETHGRGIGVEGVEQEVLLPHCYY